MRTGRPKVELSLSERERETLERWVRRPKTANLRVELVVAATGIVPGIHRDRFLES